MYWNPEEFEHKVIELFEDRMLREKSDIRPRGKKLFR